MQVLDEASGRVRIGAGAKWGDVAKVLHKHGLGVSSGDTRSVGVGSLYGSEEESAGWWESMV